MVASDHNIEWFRHTGPYIKAHRGRTFVVYLGSGALEAPYRLSLIHDLALLHSLGIRLVLVHATREGISAVLDAQGAEQHFHRGIRITDDAALAAAAQVASSQQRQIEQLLSMGLPNTPLKGSRLRVMSGNFVTGRPLGIHDGIDFQHTGSVRRVDATGIFSVLEHDAIVLLPPLAYSPAGELFSVSATELAETIAIAIGADKLILLDRPDGLSGDAGGLIRQCTLELAQQLPLQDSEQQRLRDAACRACAQGVERSHIISFARDGALIEELFTHDGAGTLIAQNPYEQARQAHIEDIAGMLELIRPLEEAGALVKRSRERLEEEIPYFTVLERDGRVIACAALYPHPEEGLGEVACVATHPDYRSEGRAKQLLGVLLAQAAALGISSVFALTTQSTHWFLEQGFVVGSPEDLPPERQRLYNWQRNASVLVRAVLP